jgi:hypothetical protein
VAQGNRAKDPPKGNASACNSRHMEGKYGAYHARPRDANLTVCKGVIRCSTRVARGERGDGRCAERTVKPSYVKRMKLTIRTIPNFR